MPGYKYVVHDTLTKFISTMNSIYFVFAFLFVFSQRSDASYPHDFHGYTPYMPYMMAAPAPVVHAAPSFYPYPMAYHHPHRELHNVAGAVQREDGLITDVAMRFPIKKTHKNL